MSSSLPFLRYRLFFPSPFSVVCSRAYSLLSFLGLLLSRQNQFFKSHGFAVTRRRVIEWQSKLQTFLEEWIKKDVERELEDFENRAKKQREKEEEERMKRMSEDGELDEEGAEEDAEEEDEEELPSQQVNSFDVFRTLASLPSSLASSSASTSSAPSSSSSS
jgi:hypothetical protein